MAKNQSTTKSEIQSQGTCPNIFKAFRRRVSPARPMTIQSPISDNRADASNKVLVDYNHSTNAKQPEPTKPGPVNTHQGPKGVNFQGGYGNNNNTSGGASNEKFTNYIDQVKKQIKANSSFVADENVGTAKRTTTRRDSFNDRVSHFINRAKLKMRTTTIVAGDHGGDGKLQPSVPR